MKERLQTISNVSAVEIWGEYRYSMRLWLDPIRMAAYNITPMDVKSALDRENVELPAGNIEGDHISQSIRTMGLMQTPEEFNNLILMENDFRIVRFRDVGYAELMPPTGRPSSAVTACPWSAASSSRNRGQTILRLPMKCATAWTR